MARSINAMDILRWCLSEKLGFHCNCSLIPLTPSPRKNQRPAQAEPVMDISPDSRQLMVNKITDKLKRHVPVSRPVELHELRKVAERFEDKIYSASRWQHEYLRKISLKMLELETKSFNVAINSLPSSSAAHSRESLRSRL